MKRLARLPIVIGFAAGLGLASPALPQDGLDPQSFVARASVSTMVGVESATLALHKTTSPAIKSFAHRLANDLGTTSSSLRQITAKRSDIAIPERPDPTHLDLMRDLNDKQGADFDRAYIAAQRKMQEENAALLAAYAEKGQDPDLRAFAAKALPLAQDLARRAQELEKPQ
jgi:putative membrane protein